MLTNIKKTFSPLPSLLKEAQAGTQMKHNIFVVCLLAVVIAIAGLFAEFLGITVYIFVKMFIRGFMAARNGTEMSMSVDMTSFDILLVQLFVTGLATIVMMLYVRFAEQRPLRTMGFVRKHAVRDYLLGMVVAFGLFAACVGLCMATGAMTFGAYTLNGRYLSLALLFVAFLIQGMSEETVCRGFMMTSLGSRCGAVFGVLFNSLFFGALHLLNSGIAPLPIINLVLFGLFMSCLVLKQHSIWMACAIHAMWNFVQGNFFGILVSGNRMGASVFRFDSVPGMSLFNGGSFGMEGGIATTLVLTLATVVVLLLPPRQSEEKE